MSLYDRVLTRDDGARVLAVSRLKRAILSTLHEAFSISGLESQSDLARRLRVRRSAVNQVFNSDGNLRISTLAEYLHAMGYELNVTVVRAGEPRAAALEGRPVQPVITGQSTYCASAVTMLAAPLVIIEQSQQLLLTAFCALTDIPESSRILVRSWAQNNAAELIPSTMLSSQIAWKK
jgi:transcriptional regulator with XRE-family HTH domain